MAQININGNSYSGSDVRIENGKVYVNGNLVKGSENDKTINILIEGNVDRVEVDYCSNIIVEGDVKSLNSTSGDVNANNVTGDLKTTSGDIKIKGDVGGSVNTVSGDVEANKISGNVKTVSGDIN